MHVRSQLLVPATNVIRNIDGIRLSSACQRFEVRITDCEKVWPLSTDCVLGDVRQTLGDDRAKKVPHEDEEDVDCIRRNRVSTPNDGTLLQQGPSAEHLDNGNGHQGQGKPDEV